MHKHIGARHGHLLFHIQQPITLFGVARSSNIQVLCQDIFKHVSVVSNVSDLMNADCLSLLVRANITCPRTSRHATVRHNYPIADSTVPRIVYLRDHIGNVF